MLGEKGCWQMSGIESSAGWAPSANARSNRSVLVIAYYFPPWGGGPVFRTLKLVKYLSRLGWDVTVLTAQDRYYERVSHDPALLQDVPASVRVSRTPSLQPSGAIATRLVNEAIGGGRARDRLSRLLWPLARAAHQLLIPDEKVLWLPVALGAGLRMAGRQQPGCIYVSAPPHSTALLGLALGRMLGRPLVLDMRDDWVGNPLYARASRIRTRVESTMERESIRAAAAVLVPTTSSREAMIAKYPWMRAQVHVVPNGFDHEDIESAQRLPPGDSSCRTSPLLRCVYTGLTTPRRDLAPLFQAIQRVNRRAPGTVQMSVAGFLQQQARRALGDLDLHGEVIELGYLPHVQALRTVIDADVAVLLSTSSEGAQTAIPSKLYEYVACGRVVLGLVDPGATQALIEQHGWGVVCPPDDVDRIENTLLRLAERKQSGTLALSEAARSATRAYSRQSQVAQVSILLEEIVRSAGRG